MTTPTPTSANVLTCKNCKQQFQKQPRQNNKGRKTRSFCYTCLPENYTGTQYKQLYQKNKQPQQHQKQTTDKKDKIKATYKPSPTETDKYTFQTGKPNPPTTHPKPDWQFDLLNMFNQIEDYYNQEIAKLDKIISDHKKEINENTIIQNQQALINTYYTKIQEQQELINTLNQPLPSPTTTTTANDTALNDHKNLLDTLQQELQTQKECNNTQKAIINTQENTIKELKQQKTSDDGTQVYCETDNCIHNKDNFCLMTEIQLDAASDCTTCTLNIGEEDGDGEQE